MQELNEFLKKILEIIEERDRKYREEMERRDKEYREEIARTNREIREEIKKNNEEFNKKILEITEEIAKRDKEFEEKVSNLVDGRVFFHFGNETEKFGVDKLTQYLKENGYELGFPKKIINKFSVLKEGKKDEKGLDEVILARKGNKNYAFLIEAKHTLNNQTLLLIILKLRSSLNRFFNQFKDIDFEFIPVIVYQISGQKDIILGYFLDEFKKYDGMEFNERNIAKILFEELKKFKVKQVIFISPINRFEIYKKSARSSIG
ncbi:MAG: hypothetical protein ABIL24_02845 [candidate division WOR-3 bacterium]